LNEFDVIHIGLNCLFAELLETGATNRHGFHIDARPALDTFGGFFDRARFAFNRARSILFPASTSSAPASPTHTVYRAPPDATGAAAPPPSSRPA
jgi:hypothetical protein